jgi:hypothetical protein
MDEMTLEQQAQEWVSNYMEMMEGARGWVKLKKEGKVGHVSIRTPEPPDELDEPLRSRVIELLTQRGEIGVKRM